MQISGHMESMNTYLNDLTVNMAHIETAKREKAVTARLSSLSTSPWLLMITNQFVQSPSVHYIQ